MGQKGPRFVYEIYIQASPAKVWEALTRFERTRRYFYGHALRMELRKGGAVEYVNPKSKKVSIVGRVLEARRAMRLAHTFKFAGFARKDRPSRVTYELEKVGRSTKLTLVHDRFGGVTRTYRTIKEGWLPILCGLKTLIETGRMLFPEWN